MKLKLYLLIWFIPFANAYGQSVTLQPSTFQLPQVSTNPACTVADKGKQIFNTNQNKVLYCNGSAWINAENGAIASITPAFAVSNYLGKSLTSELEVVEFTSEEFDLNNNFNLDDEETSPNYFLSTDNGIYEINLSAKLDLSNFVPSSATQIKIGIAKSSPNSGNNYYFDFPVNTNSDENYIHLTKILRLPAGFKVRVIARIESAPTYGVLRIVEISLTGHLVSWY